MAKREKKSIDIFSISNNDAPGASTLRRNDVNHTLPVAGNSTSSSSSNSSISSSINSAQNLHTSIGTTNLAALVETDNIIDLCDDSPSTSSNAAAARSLTDLLTTNTTTQPIITATATTTATTGAAAAAATIETNMANTTRTTVVATTTNDASEAAGGGDATITTTTTAAAAAATAATAATTMDCPICLQACIHPARLPCGHIFCFLCIKGVAYKNRRCAMCRREIPPEFLDRPQLVNGIDDICSTKTTEDGFQWFYEGRNGGWWAYDKRSSDEIEDAYNQLYSSNIVDLDMAGKYNLLVCGSIYTIDFTEMVQYPENVITKRRKIKRARHMATKGVAGISTLNFV